MEVNIEMAPDGRILIVAFWAALLIGVGEILVVLNALRALP